MLSFKQYKNMTHVDPENDETKEQMTQDSLFGVNDYIPFKNDKTLSETVTPHANPKRLTMMSDANKAKGPAGLVVPKHMWHGTSGTYAADAKGGRAGKTFKIKGMDERNSDRAKVYGSEHRDPLSISNIEKTHKAVLDDHFKKPKSEQIKAEQEAVERLHKAGHLDSKDTTDEGDKTDTVKHEYDEQGRSHVAVASKGVAGHALYTSGTGPNQKHHVINTCPQQTEGCGGGTDANNVADTLKGTCFAPKAENQYVSASIRRACHEQAKHDPAMTSDWVLAHTHSLRNHADAADKKNQRLLFRPNVVDETDKSSRHVIRHLNKQRASELHPLKIKDENGKEKSQTKPPIIGNSYGKTDELHDPENNWHVTHSNTGPKVKDGKQISENIGRDKSRIRQTVSATNADRSDIKNENGNKVPPKGSYMVISAKRGGARDKQFQQHVTHAKYWSAGREKHQLSEHEKKQEDEGHFDGSGKPTTPDKAHYGHTTINGRRYDYQKQHILHPRLVSIGKVKNKKTGEEKEHIIPTDSRFKDEEHLPKDRFKSPNGKKVGGILVTTPTTSTEDIQHHTAFTHHVDDNTIEHAKRHNGEYEIDNPHEQEKARGKEFAAPKPINFIKRKNKASNLP